MKHRRAKRMGPRATALVCIALALTLTGGADPHAQATSDGWRTFDGGWSATGTRQTLATESGRPALIVHLSGAIALASGGVGSGFGAEAIGFDDASGEAIGRAVWTDRNGNRIFSTLRGGPLQTGRRVIGTITGGTGRWANATGDYTLTWQYVVSDESDAMQGHSVDLHGRIRVSEARP